MSKTINESLICHLLSYTTTYGIDQNSHASTTYGWICHVRQLR
uniref:Uncharacterized protein n=1 Tax=Arundo donax TaxID=35708 RepID=A0A0A8XTT6_ARUDO